MEQLKVCGLFTGAGGIDLAFEQAGFKVIWANEIDRDACITYRKNFPGTVLVQNDIRNISEDSLPCFDVLVAGFPCQSFSIAGKQEGFNDKRNTGNLFFEICRILDAKKPQAVFLENVANLEKHDNGNTFRIICKELEDRGYHIKYLIANASDYGVPQNRIRIYIVCFREKANAEKFCFPRKRPLEKRAYDLLDVVSKQDKKYYLDVKSPEYQAMSHAIQDEKQIYRFHENGIRKSHGGVCFTLLAGMGYWPNRVPIIKDAYGIRFITPKEAFALQGFPDTFDISGTPEKSAYRQAGNSVCVPVIKLIADEIMKVMKASSYEETPLNEVDTLVGVLKSKKQLEISLDNHFYHFPKNKAPAEIYSLKYIALNQTPGVFGRENGIHYIGRISNIEEIPRREIREMPKESDEQYIKVSVPEWKFYSKPLKPSKGGVLFVCSHNELSAHPLAKKHSEGITDA